MSEVIETTNEQTTVKLTNGAYIVNAYVDSELLYDIVKTNTSIILNAINDVFINRNQIGINQRLDYSVNSILNVENDSHCITAGEQSISNLITIRNNIDKRGVCVNFSTKESNIEVTMYNNFHIDELEIKPNSNQEAGGITTIEGFYHLSLLDQIFEYLQYGTIDPKAKKTVVNMH